MAGAPDGDRSEERGVVLVVLAWWLAMQVVALVALPVTMKLLRFLPDRGVGFARPVGLLLVSYAFWLSGVLGFLQNSTPSLVAVMLGVAATSALLWRRRGERGEALSFLRRNWRRLLVGEALFLVGLGLFAAFRAYNPDIAHTEKPMEFAFLNAILRSESFPPHDPWLAGYAISYYYLGYVVMAVLTRMSGLGSAIAFNLTNATLFALTLSGAYSVVWNMVQAHRDQHGEAGATVPWVASLAGLFGGFVVTLMGNLEGVFEIIHAKGWASGALWRWLDVRNLGTGPVSPTWYPQDAWWWWRASRVIHDRDALGQSMEVIDEFPFFSFLLGDNHPHVLALPFILLAVAMALNVLLSPPAAESGAKAPGGDDAARPEGRAPLDAVLKGLWRGWRWEVPLWALLLGALGFLNTWDYPIYLGVFVLGYAVRRYADHGRTGRGWIGDAVVMGLVLLGLGVLLYLPFYLGFRSQAGGFGLVDVTTQPQQYLLMFGTQIALTAGLLAALGRQVRRSRAPLPPAAVAVGAGLLMLAAAFLAAGRWTACGALALAAATAGLLVWVAVGGGATRASQAFSGEGMSPPAVLALGMATAGLLLTAAVELVFLRDTFGTRMNTVFKFYYQAWVLLSLAGAFGAYYALAEAVQGGLAWRAARVMWSVLSVALVLAGFSYTVVATVSKAGEFRGEPTLNGTRHVATYRPWENDAVEWLRQNAPGEAVLLEAPGGSYTEYNWVSAATGIPTVLGWGGHELQWRGSYDEPARREPDIALVYEGADPESIARVLDRYAVEYVLVGPNERSRYGVGPAALRALERVMTRVYENERVLIYGRRR